MKYADQTRAGSKGSRQPLPLLCHKSLSRPERKLCSASCEGTARKRQPEREPASLTDLTGDLDGSLERAGQPLRDGKTEAQPRRTAAPRRRRTIERLEQEGDSSSAMPIPRSSTVSKAAVFVA